MRYGQHEQVYGHVYAITYPAYWLRGLHEDGVGDYVICLANSINAATTERMPWCGWAEGTRRLQWRLIATMFFCCW